MGATVEDTTGGKRQTRATGMHNLIDRYFPFTTPRQEVPELARMLSEVKGEPDDRL